MQPARRCRVWSWSTWVASSNHNAAFVQQAAPYPLAAVKPRAEERPYFGRGCGHAELSPSSLTPLAEKTHNASSLLCSYRSSRLGGGTVSYPSLIGQQQIQRCSPPWFVGGGRRYSWWEVPCFFTTLHSQPAG
ncbi:unnamed protein product [Ectocarpus fasciculatus]